MQFVAHEAALHWQTSVNVSRNWPDTRKRSIKLSARVFMVDRRTVRRQDSVIYDERTLQPTRHRHIATFPHFPRNCQCVLAPKTAKIWVSLKPVTFHKIIQRLLNGTGDKFTPISSSLCPKRHVPVPCCFWYAPETFLPTRSDQLCAVLHFINITVAFNYSQPLKPSPHFIRIRQSNCTIK